MRLISKVVRPTSCRVNLMKYRMTWKEIITIILGGYICIDIPKDECNLYPYVVNSKGQTLIGGD